MTTERLHRRISVLLLAMLLCAGPTAASAAAQTDFPAARAAAQANFPAASAAAQADFPAASAAAQADFPTAQAAVDALIAAVGKQDQAGLSALMGPGGERLLVSGDKIADEIVRKDFLAAYATGHKIVTQSDGRSVLTIGADDWPLPIPIVQANGRWHFDTRSGVQEIINRRIGRNEIAAIRTSLAFVDGEEAYRAQFGAYAMRLVSHPGKRDGLYWDATPGEPESPLAPLVAQAVEEGYPGATAGKQGTGKTLPYHGYFFRILKGQGASAPGGRRSYVSAGAMVSGYALLAWPAIHGSSGIMSFLVNQEGVVFQKDLGPDTAKVETGITVFDPDITWARVDITPP